MSTKCRFCGRAFTSYPATDNPFYCSRICRIQAATRAAQQEERTNG